MAAALWSPSRASADGAGSPAACTAAPITENAETGGIVAFADVGVGNTASFVCVAYVGGHTGVLTADGTYLGGCLAIDGIGTSVVAAFREAEDVRPDCNDILHIDVGTGAAPSVTATVTATVTVIPPGTVTVVPPVTTTAVATSTPVRTTTATATSTSTPVRTATTAPATSTPTRQATAPAATATPPRTAVAATTPPAPPRTGSGPASGDSSMLLLTLGLVGLGAGAASVVAVRARSRRS